MTIRADDSDLDEAAEDASAGDRGRLDRWLWCARFFKSRTLASTAVSGGRVHLNGARVKPARVDDGEFLPNLLAHAMPAQARPAPGPTTTPLSSSRQASSYPFGRRRGVPP